jgi:hypothetical protein
MFPVNNSQILAVFERLAIVGAGFAVGHGWISVEDSEPVIAAVVAIASALFAVWNNRNKRLAERTASAGMTVLAPKAIAETTKSEKIISSAENVVVTAIAAHRAGL